MKARIAYLPGDGIGAEVLQEARKVLEVIASEHNHEFEFVEADIGAIAIERHREPFPKVTEEICLEVKGRSARSRGPSEIRSFAACRACRRRPAENADSCSAITRTCGLSRSPKRWSTVRRCEKSRSGRRPRIVRELLGGIYFGKPRGMEKDQAFNTEIYSRDEVRRVAKVAFNLAHASAQIRLFGG